MPTTLGKYTLGRELGSGVSCKVKLAKDDSNQRYAIKILKPSADFDELVQTEIEALTALDHQNIIKLIEQGTGDQVHSKKGKKKVKYIVLEIAQGGELFDFVALGGALSESTARFFFGQLMNALKYCHDRGVVHRDLKPENIMLDKGYNVKVADFGFAAPAEGRDGSGLLETQLGTISYMAPEIHRGDKYDGKAVDIFAAAIILFVVLTQRPPFEVGRDDNVHYQLISQGGEEADMFWQAHAEANDDGEDIYSPEFKDLFHKMMASDPNNRPTADDVLDHPWMNGPVTPYNEIQQDFEQRKQIVDQNAHEEREQRRHERKNNEPKVRRALQGEMVDDPRAQWKDLDIHDYEMHSSKPTKFFSTSDPLNYMLLLTQQLEDKQIDYKVSGSDLKVTFDTKFYPVPEDDDEDEEEKKEDPDESEAQNVKCCVRVTQCTDEVNMGKYCIDFSYQDPTTRKNITRDERALFNFKSFLNDKGLKPYHDAQFDE